MCGGDFPYSVINVVHYLSKAQYPIGDVTALGVDVSHSSIFSEPSFSFRTYRFLSCLCWGLDRSSRGRRSGFCAGGKECDGSHSMASVLLQRGFQRCGIRSFARCSDGLRSDSLVVELRFPFAELK